MTGAVLPSTSALDKIHFAPRVGGILRLSSSFTNGLDILANLVTIGYDVPMTVTHVENILSCYSRGTFDQIRTGAAWYDEAHDLALELSPGDVWRGAGVIAAFSPLQQWELNVRNARNAFRTGIATGHTKQMCGQAQRILDGEHPLDVLGGDKTRAFAAAIADPHRSTIATIDRHAHDIAIGRVFTEKERKIGKRTFRELAHAYTLASRELGFSVAQTQAITWVIWRAEKGIK